MTLAPDFLYAIAVKIIPLILAITLHEAAHGYVAKMLGDRTAQMLGRVTLNPLKHIDPVGTLALPGILFLAGSSFLFGWAKPVPVNFKNLKDMRWSVIAVAVAGPGANLILALISAFLMHIVVAFFSAFAFAKPLYEMLIFSIQINVVLMVFNLLPLLPLDGGRIINALLPPKISYQFEKTEPFGIWIVLILGMIDVLFMFIGPVIQNILHMFNYLLP